MNYLNRNVSILTACVCLMMSASSLNIATAALVGFALAEEKTLSTLPLALQFIATMLTSVPAAMLMQRIGRKPTFLIGSLFGIGGGVLSSYAILTQSFWLFALGSAAFGIFNGISNYFRYAAAESVDVAYKSRAISFIMLGGVLAAVIGPNLAKYSREWISGAEFAGSYAAVIVLYMLVSFALIFLRPGQMARDNDQDVRQARPLRAIVGQPHYVVALICGMLGYGVMTFVMTATPLAMDQSGFLFDDTSLVIQWHVLAMFAPSFVSGNLIVRFGVLKIMACGGIFGLVCVLLNLLGTSLWHYLSGLICLGISWNFLFVGSTTMITDTYHPSEKNKAQAVNDFAIFSSVAIASLSAGALQSAFGWQVINMSAVPPLLLILASIFWLAGRRRINSPLSETGLL